MRWPDHPVQVQVPATSANLGPGFDSLGLALALHDVVQARVTGGDLIIKVSGIGEETATGGEGHLVVRAMRAAFDVIGASPPGLELICQNTIPHGYGLGSSAAAIVAGVLAASELSHAAGRARMPGAAVLQLAAEIEGHPDNVAPCLLGGLTIAWSNEGADPAGSPGNVVRCARLTPLAALRPVLCVPEQPLSTEVARQVLPTRVPHGDAARNAARAALLIAALAEGAQLGDGGRNREVLLDATQDFLHQPYRASSMPGTAALIASLRDAGVPAVVSGAGPAVLALAVVGITPGRDVVGAIAAASGQDWTVMEIEVDRGGAQAVSGHGQAASGQPFSGGC